MNQIEHLLKIGNQIDENNSFIHTRTDLGGKNFAINFHN